MKKLKYIAGGIVIATACTFFTLDISDSSSLSKSSEDIIEESSVVIEDKANIAVENVAKRKNDGDMNFITNYGIDINTPGGLVRALNEAVSKGAERIDIPEGIYDCGGQKISLNRYVAIYGAGKEQTKLKNICFVNSNGIGIYDLSIDGGVPSKITYPGTTQMDATVIIFTQPEDSSCKLEYSDCVFSNADCVSYLCSTKEIESDLANNCTFTNISKHAIYHSANIKYSEYKNNLFSEIGSTDALRGEIAGIWIGDVTNITYTQSNNVIIENNTFKDLYTADDLDNNRHTINANFISIRADVASISNNVISDIHGYGEDREGLYTKVRKLTVKDNVITNGGYGEGYITCKAQDAPDTYTIITGNIINGEYGSGISLYGPGVVKGNTINIAKGEIAVVCHSRDFETDDKIEILDNNIICNPGRYVLNGQVLGDYVPKTMFFADLSQCDLVVRGNTFTCNENDNGWQSVIDIAGVKNNATIENNNIVAQGENTVGINIHSGDDYSEYNKDKEYLINDNDITTDSFGVKIQMGGSTKTTRTINVSNNNIDDINGSKELLFVQAGKTDEVIYNNKAQGTINSNMKVIRK